jgi:hypothetical protein
VREGERERGREKEGERKGERESEREREKQVRRVCVHGAQVLQSTVTSSKR